MTQHAGSIANQAGAAFRADLNNLIAALLSANSGTSPPSPTFAFMFWEDTTAALLKQRNSANSAWITIGPAGDLGIQSAAQTVCAAGGTADALTGAFNPAMNTAVNGAPMWVRAGFSNATTTPTFKPDGAVLKTMVKASGALVPGDIAGAGHWLCIQYDSALDKYMLLNPATGIGVANVNSKIQPVAASVAANALTATINPTTLDFRSATLGSGTVNSRTVSPAVSVVVPSGATLGSVSGQQSRLILLAIDNVGTVEAAIVNVAGGVDLTETGLISTTAIGAGATSAGIVYSASARSNVPYRVVGYIESTQAAAGTWATAPSTIQGVGGQALAAMSSAGFGQTWQAVTRSIGTTYYNTTGRPITLVLSTNSGAGSITVTVNGVAIKVSDSGGAQATYACATLLIPPGVSYVISTTSSAAYTAVELR